MLKPPIEPMLAQARETVPAPGVLPGALAFEAKFDGYRCLLFAPSRPGGPTLLQSRRGTLIQRHFPDLVTAAKQLPHGLVLDGEVVVWSGDRLSFEALQRRASSGSRTVRQLAEAMPAHFGVRCPATGRPGAPRPPLPRAPRPPGSPVRRPQPDGAVDAVPDDNGRPRRGNGSSRGPALGGGARGVWPGGEALVWTNIADDGDVVALVKDLRPACGESVRSVRVHNGSHAHDATAYLTDRLCGQVVAKGLS